MPFTMTSTGSRRVIWPLEYSLNSHSAVCQLNLAPAEKREAQAGLLSVLPCNPLPGKLRPEADVARGLPQVGLAVQVVLN